MASGGENVVLTFTATDQMYLYISLGFGALAIVTAAYLRGKLLAKSPGDEKMQAVGLAIREGALAYLRQQVRTMSIFVVLLAIGLLLMFGGQYGSYMIGVWIAVSFVGGVAASYIAGYAGMIMAVNGNMRTAHAALSSYKNALEIAFQSGAVAGLLTVGMGLIGATLIFLLAGADAMKLLVGFGFGGSLAALFMRVGGGIFTKAADVGADLVGKVEAGIPEDDPRNTAVIADNVGDNVGDCAGMAADIFESYEVTLVAAIILGAATAAIFDPQTWMKLVLFALMARGVGILASIIGIFGVKGSDNVDADPLMAIRKGFFLSAGVAALGTAALAWFMMGGDGKSPIATTQLKSFEHLNSGEQADVRKVRDAIAKEKKKPVWEVTLLDLQTDQRIRDMRLDTTEEQGRLQAAMRAPWENSTTAEEPKLKDLTGYSKIDFKADPASSPVLNYTVMRFPRKAGEQLAYVSIKDEYGDPAQSDGAKRHFMYELQLKRPESKTPQGQPQPAVDRKGWFGPMTEPFLKEQIDQAKGMQLTVTQLQSAPASLYSNAAGDILMAVDAKVPNPHRNFFGSGFNFGTYFKDSKEVVEAKMKDRQTDPSKAAPPETPISLAVAEHKTVPWWTFFAAILFGILMAFAFELLTDYYVSTHKPPVREVAGVSTAGPAPMIITGFALAMESSVFSVFAIVVALMTPTFLFPPMEYGYILSFYGIALVGLGLLTTTGFILAMDTFGPISDNAQGVFEMSGAGHTNKEASKAVQRLDAAGNTTKALTKGFAIATAVVAAVALFHSYLEGAQLANIGLRLDLPTIFLGLLIGGAAPFLFAAFSINAVGRAAFQLINEVRTQFRNDPGIMKGTSKPNYAACVAIVTSAAQKELLGPGILAIALPLAVAFGFSIGTPIEVIGGNEYHLYGAQALGGFLAGAILSGQLMAVLLANAGGIWDNSKKLIEDGLYGGKGSDAHKAGVVVDTVGDPFKDTAGPALNPLIKVMNLVALLLAPVVIQPFSDGILWTVTLVCLAALAFSIWWSKRSGMSSALASADAPAIAAAHSGVPQAPKKRLTIEDQPDTASSKDEGGS